MSGFLDDLARSMALATTRRDALRILVGAVAGAALSSARSVEARQTNCPAPDGKQQFHCFCLNVNDKFFHRCCPPDDFCQCSKTGAGCASSCPGGNVCLRTCCNADQRCADPSTGLCCKENETACIPAKEFAGDVTVPGKCCGPRETCTAAMGVSQCCGPDQTAKGGTCSCVTGTKCGKDCCTGDQVCGGGKCCKRSELCGGRCCDDGEVCASGKCCRPGAVATVRGKTLCCPPNTLSFGDVCCAPDKPNCCDSETACLPPTFCANGRCVAP